MNVIISNKYQNLLQTLNVDVIKVLNGEFNAEDIISSFKDFYFQRMIIDVTAIKGYKNIENVQKISMSLDMEKVILLLDDSVETNSSEYLSQLISMGIYNFTKNIDGILYLYNTPNSYRDVAHLHKINNNMNQPVVQATPNLQTNITYNVATEPSGNTKIIGIKGVTKESGSTTLTYLMKKELEKHYKVAAVELDKRDFMFIRDENLISTNSVEIGNELIKLNDFEIVLVDANSSNQALELCDDVIYLIEPSTIKLNRLMVVSSKVLSELSNKKIVLNKSLLNNKDVRDFEYESRLEVFYNVPPVNDRDKDIDEVKHLLSKMGFNKVKV